MDKILVAFSGAAAVGLTFWFFFMKKQHAQEAQGTIHITVEGGYSPDTISLQKGAKTTLIFTRTDTNPCLEEVVIPDFKIKRSLPMRTPVSVTLEPDKIGEYQLSCGMHMYHGKIIVHE